jgi:plasmid stability protein
MASLQIRNLPDHIHQFLSHKAAREGRSLAQQTIVELSSLEELARRNRRLEVIDLVRREMEETGPRELTPSPEELIREDRDR